MISTKIGNMLNSAIHISAECYVCTYVCVYALSLSLSRIHTSHCTSQHWHIYGILFDEQLRLNGNITCATFPHFLFCAHAQKFQETYQRKIFTRITLTYTIANPNKKSFLLKILSYNRTIFNGKSGTKQYSLD